MKLLSQNLLAELKQQLEAIHTKSEAPIELNQQAIKASIAVLKKLKRAITRHQFENKWEEIDFFRNTKPQFTAILIYYNKRNNIEFKKPFGTKKMLRRYYNNELIKLQTFFNENFEFYRYYRTNNHEFDHKYFIRKKYNFRHTLDSFYFQLDYRFSTSHDYKVAQILANDKIKNYLENEIAKLKEDIKIINPPRRKTQKWTGSKVALVELIYALHAEGIFNYGKTELKEIANAFETAFEVDLGQFNRKFLEIRARKSDRAKFLNGLKEKLILRMDSADEN